MVFSPDHKVPRLFLWEGVRGVRGEGLGRLMIAMMSVGISEASVWSIFFSRPHTAEKPPKWW